MRVRHLTIVAGVILTVSLLPSFADAQAQTTTVRGQLLRNGDPAPGVQVTLGNQAVGRSWPAVTGKDGMYYFYNIPLGDYYLEVWAFNPPKTYPFKITGLPYHDLPRIPIN